VITWFGKWSICIQTWNLSDATDDSGHFIRKQVATVMFEFSRIWWIRLEGEDAGRRWPSS
jgi:hypothetical protein